ncbi:hypothetical protein SAMN05443245_4659 [Paraburkholderia fungorum]|uniref:Uncharacterized protein n=1 Tax=Paraburkholderia fungorum TaxID=134537 RepID=A0A1H1I5K9_9BURK|nr:hypothetical protein SAMN05443245_4659 [Paraburkholderia fungorum]
MKAARKPAAERQIRIESAFEVELAVGASHVESMLHVASRTACIEDLVQSFVLRHGSIDLHRFLVALADRLDARGNSIGALAVRESATYGAVPIATHLRV